MILINVSTLILNDNDDIDNSYLLLAHHVAGPRLNLLLHQFFIIGTTLCTKYYYSQFTNGETEAQRH